MNDRELLELAAKAAGYRPDGIFGRGLLVVMNVGQPDQCAFPFDPLNDDGDALRLAVKLQMEVASRSIARADCIGYEIQLEPLNGDPCAAIRRAIVRAAADIGKAMP